jgi:hypothetical protein
LVWQDQIADCFAEVDQRFAGDKISSDHAFAMVAQMRAGRVPWGEARDIFKEHLAVHPKRKRHRFTQMRRITVLIKPWLQC